MPERFIEEIVSIDKDAPHYCLVTLKDSTFIGFPNHCYDVVKTWKAGDTVVLDLRNWDEKREGVMIIPFLQKNTPNKSRANKVTRATLRLKVEGGTLRLRLLCLPPILYRTYVASPSAVRVSNPLTTPCGMLTPEPW